MSPVLNTPINFLANNPFGILVLNLIRLIIFVAQDLANLLNIPFIFTVMRTLI